VEEELEVEEEMVEVEEQEVERKTGGRKIGEMEQLILKPHLIQFM